MNKRISLYLDALRVSAAGLVFIAHMSALSGRVLWRISGLAHESVVFFFILSGYVIAFVTSDREKTPKAYSINRLSRIYSVAIPALILTILCDILGRAINPSSYSNIDNELINPVASILSGTAFVNQTWFDIRVMSNSSYWSLGYEVWYYVFFGFLWFMRGPKKFFFLAVTLLMIGPSIVLYLPIWFMGVAVQKITIAKPLPVRFALPVYLLSIACSWALCLNKVLAPINEFVHNILGNSFFGLLHSPAERFPADYLLAIFLSLNIYAFAFLKEYPFIANEKLNKLVKFASSYTFSIYLYHMPLFFLVSAIVPFTTHPFIHLIACVFVLPLTMMLGNFTEKKKDYFRSIFRKIFSWFDNPAIKPALPLNIQK